MSNKLGTAYHEAGHAVIGRVLGLACGGASIVTNEAEDEAGHAIIRDPWATISRWEQEFMAQVEQGREPLKCHGVRSAFRGTIIARMAGAEAENELLGCYLGGDGNDRREIEMMAESGDAELPDDLWRRYEPRMRRQSRRLIRKHRSKVVCVAQALLKRTTLESAEIDDLLS